MLMELTCAPLLTRTYDPICNKLMTYAMMQIFRWLNAWSVTDSKTMEIRHYMLDCPSNMPLSPLRTNKGKPKASREHGHFSVLIYYGLWFLQQMLF